jgi:hypothetical protein
LDENPQDRAADQATEQAAQDAAAAAELAAAQAEQPYTQPERRRYPRLATPPKTLVALQGVGGSRVYNCVEVGLGGMRLETGDNAGEGSTVKFGVMVNNDIVRGRATIKRVSEEGIALSYTALDMTARARLRAFITELENGPRQLRA